MEVGLFSSALILLLNGLVSEQDSATGESYTNINAHHDNARYNDHGQVPV